MVDITALVHAAQLGDTAAFESLVREHRDMAYRVASRIVPVPEDAQDVCQRAFLSAWRGLSNFRGDALFSTWLHQIVRRHALNSVSRSGRSGQLPLEFDRVDEHHGPADLAVASDDAAGLRAAIAGLPDHQRKAVRLHHFGGMSYGEVACATGSTVPAVRSHLFRARRSLATSLAGHR